MNEINYPRDVQRIQKVLIENGYEATLIECQNLWKEYSNDVSALWLLLPKQDEEVFYYLKDKIEDKIKNNDIFADDEFEEIAKGA